MRSIPFILHGSRAHNPARKDLPVKIISENLDRIRKPRWQALQQADVTIALMPGAEEPTLYHEGAVEWHLTYNHTGKRSTGHANSVNDAIDIMYQNCIRRCVIIEPRRPGHVVDWEAALNGGPSLPFIERWFGQEWETTLLDHKVRGRFTQFYGSPDFIPRFEIECEIEGKELSIIAPYDQFVLVKEVEATTARRWQALQDAASEGAWPVLEIEKVEENTFLCSAAYTREGDASGYRASSYREAVDKLYFSAALRSYLPQVPWIELAAEYPDESMFQERAQKAFKLKERVGNDSGILAQVETIVRLRMNADTAVRSDDIGRAVTLSEEADRLEGFLEARIIIDQDGDDEHFYQIKKDGAAWLIFDSSKWEWLPDFGNDAKEAELEADRKLAQQEQEDFAQDGDNRDYEIEQTESDWLDI